MESAKKTRTGTKPVTGTVMGVCGEKRNPDRRKNRSYRILLPGRCCSNTVANIEHAPLAIRTRAMATVIFLKVHSSCVKG